MNIYTDGSCFPNPGPGAWAFVIMGDEVPLHKETGFHRETTNNRMEIMAILRAMEYGLKSECRTFSIFSDSQYAIGFVTGQFSKIKKNIDLLAETSRLNEMAITLEAQIEFQWVKGHNGDPGNEAADYYANLALSKKLDNTQMRRIGI